MTTSTYFISLLLSASMAAGFRPDASSNVNNGIKNRAQIERSLNEQMGYDWRVVREKLIAQEKAEQQQQQQLGRPKVTLEHVVENHDPYTTLLDDEDDEDAIAIMKAQSSRSSATLDDDHHWAHKLSHVERGCVLVASDNVVSGEYEKAVILITEHDEQRGTIEGIIINRPLSENTVSDHNGSHNVDLPLKLLFSQSPVAIGGPIDTNEYTILHGHDYGGKTLLKEDGNELQQQQLVPGVYIGGPKNLKREARIGKNKPEVLFVKGHVEFSLKQISNEINDGKWHVAATCSDYLLRLVNNDTSNDDDGENLWTDIINRIR